MKNSIKLQPDSVFQIPLFNYPKDFVFIVNNKEFEASHVVADLISSKISNLHQADPTLNKYEIKTHSKGDFQKILDLATFNQVDLLDSELPFFTEIVEDLYIKKIDLNIFQAEVTVENVVELIKRHEKLSYFYSEELSKEIDFLSENFYKLKNDQLKEITNFQEETIESIINNQNLTLNNEDQFLNFIFQLCLIDEKYCVMYEYVYFENISKENLGIFIKNIGFDNITHGTWESLIRRFISDGKSDMNLRKYVKVNEIPFTNHLNGIFNFFRETSNINDEVTISYSSFGGGLPSNLYSSISNDSKGFYTNNLKNSWICFEFVKHKIKPSYYTIKSQHNQKNCSHPKSWVIEGSNDLSSWVVLDKHTNCSLLNSSYSVHSFPISNDNDCEFKFLRIRQTERGWDGNFYFHICSIEFYGQII